MALIIDFIHLLSTSEKNERNGIIGGEYTKFDFIINLQCNSDCD